MTNVDELRDLLRSSGDPGTALPGSAPPQAVRLAAALVLLMARGGIVRMSPGARWQLIEAALLAPQPSLAFEALRRHRVLAVLLPEVAALFGVPQLSDGREWQDVGEHQWRFVDEVARAGAPPALRFAALMHKIGKAGTPREIWPSHYKQELRAHAALQALARRVTVPAPALALAHLVVDVLDRIHAVSDMRAGPIAQLLARLQAGEQPERFEQLLALAACDWAAYPGHHAADYAKAARLRLAQRAAGQVAVKGLSADAALQARAEAIHAALRPR
ncbi:tRNA nucleotidyltransferase [Pelomonas saccharophila]|nr:tRNA nucleotidyltransferase [Roseateles saccharophilus]MDG0832047.1 tRNA nucleotidyltransferase [Roseateles saccharophilus]